MFRFIVIVALFVVVPAVAVGQAMVTNHDVRLIDRTDGQVIVGDGTRFVGESGATARDSLGLGSIATQDAGSVAITGGAISGITDLAVADGGTGASTAAAARTSLGFTNPILDAASPGAIGGTTPAAGAFTQLAINGEAVSGYAITAYQLEDTKGIKVFDHDDPAEFFAIYLPGTGGSTFRSTGALYLASDTEDITALDTFTADDVDINGGAIDGTAIGANSASTGVFTTIDTSGNVVLAGDNVKLGLGAAGADDFALYFDDTDGVLASAAGLKFYAPVAYAQLMLATNATDSSTQRAGITGRHYDVSEEPVGILSAYITSSENRMNFGGGQSVTNAATNLRFFTADNTTQQTGTERLRIDGDGDIVVKGGGLCGEERSTDPDEPAEGEYVIWMSDGTGKGDDGDVCIASKAGGATKWGVLFDHSSGSAW